MVEYSTTINGREVEDLAASRTTSPLFTLTLRADNIFGVEPAVAQAVATGYSFIIAPPPPGEYVIVGSSQFEGDAEPFSTTMTLVVEAAQVNEPPPSTEPETTEPSETSSSPTSSPSAPSASTEPAGTLGDTTPSETSAVETSAP